MLRASSGAFKVAVFAAAIVVTLVILNSVNMLRDRRKSWLQTQLTIVELEGQVLELKQRIRENHRNGTTLQLNNNNNRKNSTQQTGEPRKQTEARTLNLALVMCGTKPKVDLAKTLIYSIKMFSSGSLIHYHLVVDRNAFEELNNSRTLEHLGNYTVYDVDSYNWVFSGAENMLSKFANSTMWSLCKGIKIHLPTVISPTVDKLVMLDVDTLLISPLDSLFDRLYDPETDSSTLLHMTVDQSGHYYRNRYLTVNPQLVGFNSGVVGLHLDRMRNMHEHPRLSVLMERINLPAQSAATDAPGGGGGGGGGGGRDSSHHQDVTSDWSRFVMYEIGQLNDQVSFRLGDQDLFNAVIARHPSIVAPLPCGWNYQLVNGGSRWLRYACNSTPSMRSANQEGPLIDIKLIHGNNDRFIRPVRHIKGFAVLHAALHALAMSNEDPVIDPGSAAGKETS